MQVLPHRYVASATGGPEGEIPVDSPGLATLTTTAPPEFGGPAGYWSPETMLTATVANCFILTFRAISRKAGLEWTGLEVSVEGLLEKTSTGLRFTHFSIHALLETNTYDTASAEQLLHKAESACLVTASLSGETILHTRVLTTS